MSGAAPMAISNDFSSLLHQSLSLASQLPAPTIKRNVSQLQHAAAKLQRLHQPAAGTTTSSPSASGSSAPAAAPSLSSSSAAQLFLAQQGVNIQQQAAYLQSLSLSSQSPHADRSLAVPATAEGAQDISSFLSAQHAQMLEEIVRESNAEVDHNFHRLCLAATEEDWEREKRDMIDALGFRSGKQSSAAFSTPVRQTAAAAASAFPSPSVAFPSSSSFSSSLPVDQRLYADVIVTLNQRRLHRQPFPLITALRDAALSLASPSSSSFTAPARPSLSLYHDVADIYSLLRTLLNERDVHEQQYQREVLTERQYGLEYAASSPTLQQQLVARSVAYCEEVFARYVRAQAGGSGGGLREFVVSVVNGSAAGERVREYMDSVPVWPLIFFSLRSGDRRGALSLLTRYLQASRTENDVLLQSMQHYASASSSPFSSLPAALLRPLQEQYNHEFLTRGSASIDPYKLAVYSLLGRFSPPASLDLLSFIAESTESYLWYKLSLLDSAASLSQLQHQLLTGGEAHFNADGQHSLLFYKVLLLVGLYEQAAVFLLRTEWYSVAVHAAIALRYYGLLRTCEGEELLMRTAEEEEAVSLNVGKIVSRYVQETLPEPQHTELAFHYLFTLHPSAACSQALSSLLLHSKQTQLLIGGGEGRGEQGLFRQYLTREERRQVIHSASEVCVKRGEEVDAIELLMTGGDDANEAAALCVRELSKLVTADVRVGKRVRVVQLAQQLERAAASSSSSSSLSSAGARSASAVSSSFLSSLSLLLSLVQFFDHYHLGPERFDSALDALLPLNLLPITRVAAAAAPSSSSSAASFSSPSPSSAVLLTATYLQPLLGATAMAVLDIYYHKYQQLEGGRGAAGAGAGTASGRDAAERAEMRKLLRDSVHRLVDYVGVSGAVIGVDVHAKMLRLEALMS